MNKPVLVVMAAGMGSRYGGLKQIDPVGNHGQLIIDYSIFDARRAGFETVIFIIKHEIEADFREAIGNRLSKIMNVKYAFQQLDNLPSGYTVPEGRTKPWGTSHAILAAKDLIDGPFAVINADDYYGPEAYKVIYDYLCSHDDKDGKYEFSMVGYLLENTVTENGHVARGVCEENSAQYLTRVTERTHIEKTENGARYTEDDGATWTELDGKTIVSMNLWGFTKGFVRETENRFSAFLDANLPVNPLKCEYFLPSVVSQLVESDKAQVKVLRSGDKWYGVTYKEDKPVVMAAIAEKTASGMYPDNLWEAK
ncbi:MAG: sugar phosphate nucleotidyltransferase [Oscillospiraceae bacterium]